MRPPQDDDADLRHRFQSLTDGVPLDEAALDRVWGAVSGELPPNERREVVDNVARDPSWALAWRLAYHLWTESQEHDMARPLATLWTRKLRYGAALAATLLVTVGVARMWHGPTEPAYRENDPGTGRIDSLVPQNQELSRSEFLLRWEGPPAATFEITISSEDLRHLHTKSGLTTAAYQVPSSFLAEIPAGTRLLWKVSARLPDGSVVVGSTFAATLNREQLP
jgi:hypothetical protein